MRAAYVEETGPVENIRVGDLPRPSPNPGQALVRVKAAAINPIDLYIRAGTVAMPLAFPYVIGTDVAGTVEELGTGVTRFAVGDRVWGSNQGLLGRQGVAAEFAAIDEEWLYPTPDALSDTEAAALALTGITAHLGLFQCGRLKSGESVYVPGGSGGVGSMVIQMARAVGARVATSAGNEEKLALCRSLGADLALNYKSDDLPAKLREFAPEGLDVWYETQREPNLDVAIPLLRKRGRMILMAGRTARPVLPLGSFYPRDCSLIGFAMFNASADEQRRSAEEITEWVAPGRLKPIVGKVFPLERAAEAERLLEANTLGGAGTLSGKVVISIPCIAPVVATTGVAGSSP
ncbi:MAG: NADPH:quinone reductase, partial [Isosphaeraceae bacterium]